MLTARRPLALGLASLLLAAVVVTGFSAGLPSGPAHAAPLPGAGEGVGLAPRLPLVLVAGWGDDPAGTWGTDRPGGLYGYLLELGYRPGQDLLVLPRSPAGEGRLGPAIDRLEEAVDRARCLSGGRPVGLVAHGEACLLCRLYLAVARPTGVEVLAMIAPPNHGAAWAGYLRLSAETERQGAASRLQPPLGAGGPGEFASAGTYVDRRSRLIYEPLYRQYVLEGRLTREPGKDEPGHPALFEAWLAQEQAPLWAENLTAAGRPPLGDPLPGPAALATPVQGRGLSRAFYEFLALNVARFRTLAGWSNLGEEVWGLVSSLLDRWLRAPGRAPEGWAGETATVLGRYLLDQAEVRSGSLVATRLARLKGIDPWSPRLEALLPEELFLPGSGPAAAPMAVPLNQALRGFNRWEAGARAAADRGLAPARPRYVVVTGRAAKPWTPAVQGRLGWGPDWEARSAVLEMTEDDALAIWDGSVSAGDLWLLYHPRVHAFLAEQLVRPGRAAAAHRLAPGPGTPALAQGRLEVTPWETSFLLAGCSGAGSAVLEMELTAPPPYCPALRLAAWLHLDGPGGRPLERRRLEPETSAEGSRLRLQVEGWGDRVRGARLGLRLEPAWRPAGPETLEPLPPLPEGTPLEVQYRLAVAAPPAAPGPGPAGPAPQEPAGGETPGPGAPEAPGGDTAPAPAEPEGPPPASPPEAPGGSHPLIVVQRRDKRTTTRYERRTSHSRWEWDFGDGSTQVDPDPTHLVGDVEHAFTTPGHYTVRATSISNHGTALRTGSWEVEVPPGLAGRPQAFRLETAREPQVRVTVKGPREWVTGRPAEFTVEVAVDPPPGARCRVTSIDPGPAFAVLWEHPGEYQVVAAATVQVTYEFPEGTVTVWNTYLGSVTVVVLATSVSD